MKYVLYTFILLLLICNTKEVVAQLYLNHFNLNTVASDYLDNFEIDSIVFHKNVYFDKYSSISITDFNDSLTIVNGVKELLLESRNKYITLFHSTMEYIYVCYEIDGVIKCIVINKQTMDYNQFDLPATNGSIVKEFGVYEDNLFLKLAYQSSGIVVNMKGYANADDLLIEKFLYIIDDPKQIDYFVGNQYYINNHVAVFYNFISQTIKRFSEDMSICLFLNPENTREIARNTDRFPMIWGMLNDCFVNLTSIVPFHCIHTINNGSLHLLSHYYLGKYVYFRIFSINNENIDLIFDSNNFRELIYPNASSIMFYDQVVEFEIRNNLIFFIFSGPNEHQHRKNFEITPFVETLSLVIYDMKKKELIELPEITVVD